MRKGVQQAANAIDEMKTQTSRDGGFILFLHKHKLPDTVYSEYKYPALATFDVFFE